jgi:hypothetical protein
MSEDYVALNVQIPKALAQAMADYKEQTGVSITALVRKALEDRLNRQVVEAAPRPCVENSVVDVAEKRTEYRAPLPVRVLTAAVPPRVVGK